jgi:hypothetical protein
MTDLQLSAVISQALFVGTVYERQKSKEDFDELLFRTYIRGMLAHLMKDLNVYDENVIEKAIEDFAAMGNF